MPNADELTEAQLQRYVLREANSLDWKWMHVGRTGKYQKVGAKGPLGTGWPDLILVRGDRMIAAELKRQDAPPAKTNQTEVLKVLSQVKGIEVYVWRPSDLAQILYTLT